MCTAQRAFSLIEVLAALVILSMCIAIVMPTWLKIRGAQDELTSQVLAQDAAHQLDDNDLNELITHSHITNPPYYYTIEFLESNNNNTEQLGQWVLIHVSEESERDHILASALRMLFREPASDETEQP